MPAGYSYRGGLIKKDFGEIFLAAKVEDENMFQKLRLITVEWMNKPLLKQSKTEAFKPENGVSNQINKHW